MIRAQASWPDDLRPGAALVLATPNSAHAIARSLGRLGIEVYAVYSNRQGIIRSRYWRRIFVLDIAEDAGVKTAVGLAQVGKRIKPTPPLIATTDEQVRFVAAHSDVLERNYLLSVSNRELIARLSDKQRLFHLCSSMGIPTPAVYFPGDPKEAERVASSARLPLILKARTTHSSRKQVRQVAPTPSAVARLYSSIDPAMYMLQEYVPRANGSRWMFNGYFDATHKCLFGATGTKIREHPVDGGVASLAEARWNPRLAAEAIGFLERIGYVGPVDIDYCYDDRSDTYMVLDVNPRIGASFRTFVDSRGWDVARVMVADLTGNAVRPGVPVDGRRWLAEHADLPAAVQLRRRGQLSGRRYVESVRAVRELAWFSVDDPRPLLDFSRRAAAKLRDAYRRRLGGSG